MPHHRLFASPHHFDTCDMPADYVLSFSLSRFLSILDMFLHFSNHHLRPHPSHHLVIKNGHGGYGTRPQAVNNLYGQLAIFGGFAGLAAGVLTLAGEQLSSTRPKAGSGRPRPWS